MAAYNKILNLHVYTKSQEAANEKIVILSRPLLNPNLCSPNGLEKLVQKKNTIRVQKMSDPIFVCPEMPETQILFAQKLLSAYLKKEAEWL